MNNHWLQRLLNGGNTTNTTPSSEPQVGAGYNQATTQATTTPQQLDSFLANSISQLTARQRESILEELHGIQNNENPESNPATLDLGLQMLDVHLQNIKRGTVYEVAEAIDRASVNSRSFRLMFLRACRYDPEAAARQVIRFLEFKRSLFGLEKITKKITLADLNDEDKSFLASGAVQVSKERDRSGRAILLIFPSLQASESKMDAMLRSRYYALMSMAESEENQRKGIVFVYFGALPTQPNQHMSAVGVLFDLPIFFSALHTCLNELSAYVLISVAILRLPFNLRPRVRVHYGSCTDCLYKLSSFGIAPGAVLTDANEPPLNDHSEWYRRRQNMELAYVTDSDADTLCVTTGGAIVPRPADVLFGTNSRQNDGNMLMKNLVVAMMDEHNEARKGRKMELTQNVIGEIKKTGGRFLKQNGETKEWIQVSDTEACRKIAHTFRNIRRPSRAKKMT